MPADHIGIVWTRVPILVNDELGDAVERMQPAGAHNATRRGQTPEKYANDYKRGLLSEIAAGLAMGSPLTPAFVEAENLHAADIPGCDVKSASTYRGETSWVYQDTAIEHMSKRWQLLCSPNPEGWWRTRGTVVAYIAGIPGHVVRPLLKPPRNGNPTKHCLYARDIGYTG
jgi:hypothetical protein